MSTGMLEKGVCFHGWGVGEGNGPTFGGNVSDYLTDPDKDVIIPAEMDLAAINGLSVVCGHNNAKHIVDGSGACDAHIVPIESHNATEVKEPDFNDRTGNIVLGYN